MSEPSVPKLLCPRCGAILPIPDRGRDDFVRCTECQLGGRGSVVTFNEPTGPIEKWRARRKAGGVLREHQRRGAVMARSARFPLYGLDSSWKGRRWLGGWSSVEDAPERITLGHGDPSDSSGPVLRVSTRSTSHLPHSRVVQDEARSLAMTLWSEGAEHTAAIRAPFNDVDSTAGWDTTPIKVEGHGPLGFKALRAGSLWIGLGPIEEVVVGIEARNVEPTELHLVAVGELDPYLGDFGLPRI